MSLRPVSSILLLLAVGNLAGCALTSHMALLSRGNLEGRRFSNVAAGPTVHGENCGFAHHLSTAFDDAVKATSYDTLTDVSVTSTTGIFVWSNCIQVTGYGVRSAELPQGESR
jgi:hypothetical protein